MKKLFTALALLTAVIFNQAFAMSAEEQAMMYLWNAEPQVRDEITVAFWENMKLQVADLQPQLPFMISETTAVTGVEMINRTITYKYITTHELVDGVGSLRPSLLQKVCPDAGNQFTLNEMGGSFIFAYYRPNEAIPFDIYSVTASDCESLSDAGAV